VQLGESSGDTVAEATACPGGRFRLKDDEQGQCEG